MPWDEEASHNDGLLIIEYGFPEPKFRKDEELLHHPDFVRICQSSGKHQNSSMTADEIKIVWVMRCDGVSNRQIAKNIGKNECSIRRIIKKISMWIDII